MAITLNPPRSSSSSSSPPPQTQSSPSPPSINTFAFSAPPSGSISHPTFIPSATSPVAPAYSPITPKVKPILPAPNGAPRIVPPPEGIQHSTSHPEPPAIAPAEFIPEPPPKPFSSEDSTDAIALRAAISALQFQKKKAQEDLRALEATKRSALEDPRRFRDELVAGRMREHRPQFGSVEAIIDGDDSDSEDMESDDEAAAGAPSADVDMTAEIPDSQPSRPGTSSANHAPQPGKPPDFSRVPGPQNVVRMPYINWEKYHIAGEALEHMHEQQRKWPGSHFAYGQERGREYSVAAPYSPFQDVLQDQSQDTGDARKDSGALQMPTGTVSEHPMETRRTSKNQP